MPRTFLTPSLLAAGLALAAGAQAADPGGTALTIYSSARPGAVPVELYRPIPGGGVPNGMAVPGYAMVRDTRTMKLAAGRSTALMPLRHGDRPFFDKPFRAEEIVDALAKLIAGQ